jgi:hypothetical protein
MSRFVVLLLPFLKALSNMASQDIEVVINYDFPAGFQGVEDYVHRIGRTARGTAEGVVQKPVFTLVALLMRRCL